MNKSLEDREVVLESMAVKPFESSSDWYGTDGEVVVTFETMKSVLWRSWKDQCVKIKKYDEDDNQIRVEDSESFQEYLDKANNAEKSERVVKPEEFKQKEKTAPGIYRDGTYYDDEESVDEGYTIVVPYGFLTPELCTAYLEKLNQKFDRSFSLSIEEDQKSSLADLKQLKAIYPEKKEVLEELEQVLKEDKNQKAAALYEEGYVEDLGGRGSWHIEHLQDNTWFFGAELEGEYTKFHIMTDNEGRIVVEPMKGSEEHVKEIVEERG